MRAMICALLLIAVAVCTGATGSKGTAPRTSASRYPAHAEVQGLAVGAIMLTQEQARKNFISEVNKCCVVVEFAIYPEAGKSTDVSLNDFTLRIPSTDIAGKPASAKLVAATLQKDASHPRRDITVAPSVGVGYESGRGYDPITGTARGGVTTSTGVGVGVGSPTPRPGSSDRDRDTMETELLEKGLPEGTALGPVAGYLYFPLSVKRKTPSFQLEYTAHGDKIVLNLVPARPNHN
jgi:hypothetical protein